jgi:uncharacterized protein YaiE (UPF0345 family)
MKHFVKVLCCIIALSVNNRGYAQVTIGVIEDPSKGSLLQLKELNGVIDGTLPNAYKGFSLPRVALTDRNKLYPMFGSASAPSADYDTSDKIAAVNKEHVGLLVYNTYETPTATDPNLTFLKGIFVWTGSRWESIRVMATNALSFTGVDNGLSLSNGTIQLGGDLTKSTDINVNANSQDFKINVVNNSDEATHGFFIQGLETQVSSTAVVADVNTGKLGLSPVIPAKLAFFQSAVETRNYNIRADINAGKVVVVPWTTTDCVTNNLLDFHDNDDTFELREDCMIEISAMVAYRGGLGTPDSTIVINATLQVKRCGASDWINYSSVRGIYISSVSAYRNTLNIPPTLLVGKEGDQIRLVLQRPGLPNVTPYSGLGAIHREGRDANGKLGTGVVVPYGTSFSRSIKIIAQ